MKRNNKNKFKRFENLKLKAMLNYFEKNNIGYDFDTNVKNNYSRYKIYKCFDDFYFDKNELDLINLLKALKENIENLNNCYRRSLEFDKDYRTGEESYGYKNEENIINNLIYVSDRWNCSFRIKWIIDLINLKKDLI